MSRFRAHPVWTPAAIVVGLAATMLLIAGCGGGSDNNNDNGEALTSVGAGEGQLDIICWAGYCEDGSTDPSVDWVSPFEQQTGCQTNVKIGDTSDQMVDLMRSGQYDGVSASGNATARLVEGGDVSPVNTDLVPNYKTIFDDLKNKSYNTFDGTNYGIPHGRGADLLMWRTDDVKPSPTSWSVILDPTEAAKYKGHISVYDDPIYIADAAVYLKAHQPDLGITNPYELDDDQFNAAVDLLKQQQPNVGDYWSNYLKQINLFKSGDNQVGTTWQLQYFTLLGEDAPVAAPGPDTGFVPTEGATGWSDTWMIAKDAAHPNCMYKWMNYITSPDVQAQVAQWFGEAPAQSKACDEPTLTNGATAIGYDPDPKFCDNYHAADPEFWKRVYFWNTPLADCGDDRGDVCKDYNDWVSAWTEIKG
jgi:putative spermidine/putrescine transport system substrate-binding protein